MTLIPGQELPWTEPGWWETATAWIRAEVERRGWQVNGAIEQPHLRPWSTVLRVPTTAGDLYFKAGAPALAHEPALTQALAGWRPDCIPAVLAADTARGWLLMPDGGVSLRSLIQADRDLGHWRRVLPLYAGLQIEMADRPAALLALGAFDRRLSGLPAQYAQLLADTEALRLGQADGLSLEEYERLRALTPGLEARCEALADYALPETLHHDDFHDGNILVRDGHYLFFDWAESCVAHPFFTLLVTLRSLAYTLKLDADAPELAQLRDLYLEAWTGYASRQDLLAAFQLAQPVAMANRALTWHRALSGLPPAVRAPHAEAVPGWLQEFLQHITER